MNENEKNRFGNAGVKKEFVISPQKNSPTVTTDESMDCQEDKTTLKKPRISESGSEAEKQFEQCLALIESQQSPEKVIAGVVLLVRLHDTNEFTSEQVVKLCKAFSLLNIKALLSTVPPASQPRDVYLRPALNLLMCYIPHCHGSHDLYTFYPCLMDLVMARDHQNDDVVKEAFACIALLTSKQEGMEALINCNIVTELCSYIKQETCYADLAMLILRQCCSQVQSKVWLRDSDTFSELMVYLCRIFASEQNEKSFDICDALRDIVPTAPKELKDMSWKKDLYEGLSNAMKSKLSADFRNRTLLLASAIIDTFGVKDFCDKKEQGSELFMLMVQTACVEVRMSLEDKTVEEAISASVSTTGCYSIMEAAINTLVNGVGVLSEKQHQVLYSSLKEAVSAVLVFLSEASLDSQPEVIQSQIFVVASVRVLGAWIAEETTANHKEIYQLLPFIINLARKNYESVQDQHSGTDLLRFLLPGLCHLTAEDVSRKILLDLDLENFLMEYLMSVWNKACSHGEKTLSATLSESSDPMITISNIFMNIVVQESDRVKKEPVYYQLLRWIMNKISEIPIDQDNLHLSGCFSTLGLLVLRNQYQNIPRSENCLFKFIQCAVRFLWDAYNIEESHDYRSLVVSSWYSPIWADLSDLWYIGIHSLSVMLDIMPWLTDFLVESEYPQALIGNLLLIKPDGIDETLKCTFEEFFIALIKTRINMRNLFILKGADKVIETHNMQSLKNILKL